MDATDSSSWWKSALDTISGLGTAGAEAYNKVTSADAAKQQAAAATANANKPTTPTWLLPVAIGVGALVLLVVLVSAFRK